MIKKRWLLATFSALLFIISGGFAIWIMALPAQRSASSVAVGTSGGSQANTSLAPNVQAPVGSGSIDFASSAPPDPKRPASTAASSGISGELIAGASIGPLQEALDTAPIRAAQASGGTKLPIPPSATKVPGGNDVHVSPTPSASPPSIPPGAIRPGNPRPLDHLIALSDPARKPASSAAVVTPASGAGQIVTIAPGSESDPPTAEEKALAEAVSEQARKADIVIEVPKSMEVGTSYVARLIVSRGKASSATPVDPAKVVFDETFPVAVNVKAFATSPTMTVKAADPPEKMLLAHTPAIWAWKVDPVAEKEAILTISLEHRITLPGGKEIYVPVGPFPQTIAINVGLFARMSGWTDQLGTIGKLALAITAALGAVTGLFAAVRGLWPKKPRSNPPLPSG